MRDTFQVRACSRKKTQRPYCTHVLHGYVSNICCFACWYVSVLVGPFAPSNTMGMSSICIVSVLRFARWRHSISVHTVRSVSHGRGGNTGTAPITLLAASAGSRSALHRTGEELFDPRLSRRCFQRLLQLRCRAHADTALAQFLLGKSIRARACL